MSNYQKWKKAIAMEIAEHKSSSIVYTVLRVLVIAVLVRQLFMHNYENAFLCVLTLLLFIVPSLLQVTLRIELPTTLEIIILLFIFSAEILGEIHAFYIKIPFWDTVLHTLNGFLAAAIGFSLVELLNRHQKVKFELSPLFMAIVAFCFSMTIGVLWEFFEFAMDRLLLLDMQKDTVLHTISTVMLDPSGANHPQVISQITEMTVNGENLGLGGYLDIGLYDTMKDLFVNFIGAVVFSALGYIYVKTRGKGRVANRLIPHAKDADKDYLNIVWDEQKEALKNRKKIKPDTKGSDNA